MPRPVRSLILLVLAMLLPAAVAPAAGVSRPGLRIPRVDGRIGEGLREATAFCAHQGEVLAAGLFAAASGPGVARWSATGGWQSVCADDAFPPRSSIHDLVSWRGRLIAVGSFPTDAPGCTDVAMAWDGQAWRPLASDHFGTAFTAAVHHGALVVGGMFWTASMEQVSSVLAWTGNAWAPVGDEAQDLVTRLLSTNGGLYAGTAPDYSYDGSFAGAVHRWDGATWQQVGDPFFGQATALFLHQGRVHAAFSGYPGSYFGSCLKRWDGDVWTSLGGQCDEGFFDVAAALSFKGRIVAGGVFPRDDGLVGGVAVLAEDHWDIIASPHEPGPAPDTIGLVAAVRGDELWIHGDFMDIEGVAADGEARLLFDGRDGSDGGRDGGRVVLHGNTPNPFNPSTTIAYTLPTPMRVTVQVCDPAGRLVRTLADGSVQDGGRHAVSWDGRDEGGRRAAAGVYLCRLRAGDQARTVRLVLVK